MSIPRTNEPLTVGAPQAREILVSPEPPRNDISAVSLLNMLLRHRATILTLSLALGVYGGAKSVTSPKYFTTEAQFMPRGARGQSQLGNLAAQFGVNIGGGDPSQSPQLYTDLLEAKALLWPIAQKTYRITTDSGVVSGNLIRIFNVKDPRPQVVKARVIGALKGAIRSTLAPKTGVISVTVSTAYPELSLQIGKNLLAQVNEYNLANRQREAADQRVFVERQLSEKRAELRQAEADMETFLEANRQYRLSPQLTLEYNRLQRRVDMRNQLHTSMLQAYEQARIEEVRDLPVITIIEHPELPIGPDRRGGLRKTLIGMLIGFLLGCALALMRERIAHNRTSQSDEFLEFAALKREALTDLTHPWRPLGRAFGSRSRS